MLTRVAMETRVKHKIRGYEIQKRVSKGKKTSEGKCLNDSCVLGLAYK